MKRDLVLAVLQEEYQELAERFGIASLYLFGSVARDEAYPGSDVDLMVEFTQPIGLFDFIELQQILESILGCRVDLGTKRSLRFHQIDQVIAEANRVA